MTTLERVILVFLVFIVIAFMWYRRRQLMVSKRRGPEYLAKQKAVTLVVTIGAGVLFLMYFLGYIVGGEIYFRSFWLGALFTLFLALWDWANLLFLRRTTPPTNR